MGWIATRLHRDQCERQRDPDRRSVVTSPTMRAIAHASCHATRHMAATPQLLIADDWLNPPVEHSGWLLVRGAASAVRHTSAGVRPRHRRRVFTTCVVSSSESVASKTPRRAADAFGARRFSRSIRHKVSSTRWTKSHKFGDNALAPSPAANLVTAISPQSSNGSRGSRQISCLLSPPRPAIASRGK
jgi:hypothetical protein